MAKRRAHLPNNKKIKKNVQGTDRFKSEGPWRSKDAKTSSHNKKTR